MQVYIGSNFMCGFDKWRIFRARYIVGNSKLNQEHKRHDNKNIGQGGLLLIKNKLYKN